jgi:hypothetical protein
LTRLSSASSTLTPSQRQPVVAACAEVASSSERTRTSVAPARALAHGGEHLDELIDPDRLRNVAGEALLGAHLEQILAARCGEHDQPRVPELRFSLDRPRQLLAVFAGHQVIDEHDLEGVGGTSGLVELAQRIVPAWRARAAHAVQSQL